jgi:hypothetical protein
VRLLRGHTTRYHLIEGRTDLFEPSLYPFNRDEIPVFFECPEAKIHRSDGYHSGARSIAVPVEEGRWLKSKGVGIHTGDSKPKLRDGRVYTYYLSQAMIGDGQLIWGLSSLKETEMEVSRMVEALELGLTKVKPVGVGYFDDVLVLDCKDRAELFKMVKDTSEEDMMCMHRDQGRPLKAACVFVSQPTDARVDEVLYGFLHPLLPELAETQDLVGFLKWVGSSCGYNLRAHHDAGLIHGTIPKGETHMTNSHTANHLIDEEGVSMTDYHMTFRSRDKRLRRLEAFTLTSQMNPLPMARRAAGEVYGGQRPLLYDLGTGMASPFSYTSIEGRWFKPGNVHERFTEAFLDGVIQGYDKRQIYSVEAKLRRDILLKAAVCKRDLLVLLGLPVNMQRGAREINRRVAHAKFSEENLRASRERIDKELGE